MKPLASACAQAGASTREKQSASPPAKMNIEARMTTPLTSYAGRIPGRVPHELPKVDIRPRSMDKHH